MSNEMTDEQVAEEVGLYGYGIWVLPSESGVLPRAIVGPIAPLAGNLMNWSADLGCWVGEGGIPADPQLSRFLTARCKNLGMEAFG